MKALFGSRFIVAVIVALLVGALMAPASAQSRVATVSGGGQGDFINHPGTTHFGMNFTIYSDGTAYGDFECGIDGVVTLNGPVTNASIDSSGLVTYYGVAEVRFIGAAPFLMPYVAWARAGGPGVATFAFPSPIAL